MPTKSILKNIMIKDKKSVTALVNALEQSEKFPVKEISYSKPIITADEETVKKMFEEKRI